MHCFSLYEYAIVAGAFYGKLEKKYLKLELCHIELSDYK